MFKWLCLFFQNGVDKSKELGAQLRFHLLLLLGKVNITLYVSRILLFNPFQSLAPYLKNFSFHRPGSYQNMGKPMNW